MPAFDERQVRTLLESIDTSQVVGIRDKTLLMVLAYTAARAGAVAKLKVGDYATDGRSWHFHFGEKGGKLHVVPARHDFQLQMERYIQAAGLAGAPAKAPLFRTTRKKKRVLSDRDLTGNDLLRIVKRRLRGPACHRVRSAATRSGRRQRRTC